MQFAIALMVLPIILAAVASRWGVDSTEKFDSAEWRRRRDWFGGSHQQYR